MVDLKGLHRGLAFPVGVALEGANGNIVRCHMEVIALLSFFAFRVLLESEKANRLRAAWTSLKRRAQQYPTIDYPGSKTSSR